MSYTSDVESAIEFLNSGEQSKFKASIFDILSRKVNDAIEARKELVAQTIFNSDEE